MISNFKSSAIDTAVVTILTQKNVSKLLLLYSTSHLGHRDNAKDGFSKHSTF